MKKKIYLFTIVLILFGLINNASAQHTNLFDFSSMASGSEPYGSLISDGTFLYGMTLQGGINNMGTIFKIMPDGSGYIKLLDFAGAANGNNPYGSLISDGTFLYGMTRQGGINDLGTLFKIMPDGSGYVKLLDFAGAANGNNPYGSLISDGTFLYGMTRQGGINDLGTLFKIMPDGSGYVKLLDFAGAANGSNPNGSLISDGTFLYGMTSQGGINNMGTIFKIMPDGSGYIKLLDFAGAANGSNPTGSLITDGTFLYGMTGDEGIVGLGTLFKIMPDGSGYIKLLDFAGAANGSNPTGSLITDGTFLYGMTTLGGLFNLGTVFKVMPDGSGYVKLLDFAGAANGRNPYGDLISDGTFLYGMTTFGGVNDMGTIFKFGDAVGIVENNLQANISIYPNPSSGKFQFVINGLPFIENHTVEIYDMLGEKIYAATINSDKTEIDLNNPANGIYFVNISNGINTYSGKIIIEQ